MIEATLTIMPQARQLVHSPFTHQGFRHGAVPLDDSFSSLAVLKSGCASGIRVQERGESEWVSECEGEEGSEECISSG